MIYVTVFLKKKAYSVNIIDDADDRQYFSAMKTYFFVLEEQCFSRILSAVFAAISRTKKEVTKFNHFQRQANDMERENKCSD